MILFNQKSRLMNDMSQDNLIELLKVLSQETRINILKILIHHGPLTFSELNSILGLKYNSKLSFHLTKLKELNLVAMKSGGEYVITDYGKKVYDKLNELLVESGFSKNIIVYNLKGIPHIFSREEIINYLKGYNLTRGKMRDLVSDIENVLRESGINEIYQDELFGLIFFILLKKGVYTQKRTDMFFLDLKEILRKNSLFILESLRDMYVIKNRMSGIIREFIGEGYFYIWHPYYLYNGYSAILYKPLINENFSFSSFLKTFFKLREIIGEHIIDNTSFLFQKEKTQLNDIRQGIDILNDIAEKNYKLTLIVESPELVNKKYDDERILRITSNLFRILSEHIFPNLLFIIRIDDEDLENKKIMSNILKMINNGQSIIVDLFPERTTIITSNLFKISFHKENEVELLRYAIGINMPVMLVKSIQRKIDFLDILGDAVSIIEELNDVSLSLRVINNLKELLGVNISGIVPQNNLAFTGFHYALKTHHSYLEIKDLKKLTERFWREMRENYENDKQFITSGIVCEELYEQLKIIESYSKKITGVAKIYDFNTIGPFSYYEDYTINQRIEIEKVFQNNIDSGDIFNIYFSPSSIMSTSFLSKFFMKMKKEKIRWVTFSYELSKCLSCLKTFRGINLICPSCLSTNILNLIKPFTSYIDKNSISSYVVAEYNMRKKYSISDVKKFLLP